MTTVLIQTCLGDSHAAAVQMGLSAKGHKGVRWFASDFPQKQSCSIRISPESRLGYEAKLAGSEGEVQQGFDVVWARRPTGPSLPAAMHAGDQWVVKRESERFLDAVCWALTPDAFWVNAPAAHLYAKSKANQLIEARKAGLKIPETLMSNCPDDICRFIDESDGKVVYKSFLPAAWRMLDGQLASLVATVLHREDVPADQVLQHCPGIYQSIVEKDYEIRATFMGRTCLAAKLDTQAQGTKLLDTRPDWSHTPTSLYKLPDCIYQACLRLMDSLGIVFGCFDLVRSRTGEIVFLEVNPMGQFLWMENLDPRIRLLDAFCEFLISRDREFHWCEKGNSISYADVASNGLTELLRQDSELHLDSPNELMTQD